MRPATIRLRPALALLVLAWVAQFCLPVVHAAMMAAPRAAMSGWCGDPSRVLAFAATLPAEIREALDPDGASAGHVDDCAALCASGATPPLPTVARSVALPAVGCEFVLAAAPAPCLRDQAPTPPSQGPPAQA